MLTSAWGASFPSTSMTSATTLLPKSSPFLQARLTTQARSTSCVSVTMCGGTSRGNKKTVMKILKRLRPTSTTIIHSKQQVQTPWPLTSTTKSSNLLFHQVHLALSSHRRSSKCRSAVKTMCLSITTAGWCSTLGRKLSMKRMRCLLLLACHRMTILIFLLSKHQQLLNHPISLAPPPHKTLKAILTITASPRN